MGKGQSKKSNESAAKNDNSSSTSTSTSNISNISSNSTSNSTSNSNGNSNNNASKSPAKAASKATTDTRGGKDNILVSPRSKTIRIDFSRLQFDKKRLGKGGMGVVFSGLLDEKIRVAIKKLDVSTDKQRDRIMAEAKMMAELGHKYVVGMHGVSSLDYRDAIRSQRSKSMTVETGFRTQNHTKLANHHRGESLAVPSKSKSSIYIVMELCDGSLDEFINHPDKDANFDTHSLNISLQVAETMAFLHDKKDVSHRDLKPGNILLCHGDVRLCDFGLSKNLTDATRNTLEIGTPTYMPPELFVDPSLDPDDPAAKIGPADIDARKSDVYAFGIILWALYNRKQPYGKLSTFRIIYKVKSEGMRPEIEDNTSPDIVKLFEACWHTDQQCRPDFKDIFNELMSIKRKGSWFKRS